MSEHYDVLIRNAAIVDGSGAARGSATFIL